MSPYLLDKQSIALILQSGFCVPHLLVTNEWIAAYHRYMLQSKITLRIYALVLPVLESTPVAFSGPEQWDSQCNKKCCGKCLGSQPRKDLTCHQQHFL